MNLYMVLRKDSSSLKKLLCTCVVLSFMLFMPHAQARDIDLNLAKASKLIGKFNGPKVPGCAIGVQKNSSWIFRSAYGLANLEKQIANTPDMIFGVASITKQFTAAATLIASHEGYFSLNDDIRRYIPEMPDYGIQITVNDLIHHTNGLRDIDRLVGLTGQGSLYTSLKNRVSLLSRQKGVNFPAGTEYRYGNSGYMLLATLIERTTGQPFSVYVDVNIFQPLAMTDSYFGVKTRGNKGRALSYSENPNGWQNTDKGLEVPGTIGEAGLMTTLDDYSKWARNLFAKENKLVGGSELIQKLKKPGTLNDGTAIPYGFGLKLNPYRGLAAMSHGGSGYGYKAFTMNFPEQALGVFVFCNNGLYAQSLAMSLADIFLDVDARETTADNRPSAITLPFANLEDFEGVYREPSLRLPMIVKANNTGVYITGDAVPSAFMPITDTQFRNAENIIIEFGQDSNGHAFYFTQKQGRKYGTGTFKRIEAILPQEQYLLAYAGDYYSAELDVTYRFSVKGSSLISRALGKKTNAPEVVFQTMLKDEFVSIPYRLAIRFQWSGEPSPSGFALTHQFGWITDIKFERVRT